MAFECNIDARGQAYRLRLGFKLVIVGLVLSAALFLADVGWGLLWLIPGERSQGALSRCSRAGPVGASLGQWASGPQSEHIIPLCHLCCSKEDPRIGIVRAVLVGV